MQPAVKRGPAFFRSRFGAAEKADAEGHDHFHEMDPFVRRTGRPLILHPTAARADKFLPNHPPCLGNPPITGTGFAGLRPPQRARETLGQQSLSGCQREPVETWMVGAESASASRLLAAARFLGHRVGDEMAPAKSAAMTKCPAARNAGGSAGYGHADAVVASLDYAAAGVIPAVALDLPCGNAASIQAPGLLAHGSFLGHTRRASRFSQGPLGCVDGPIARRG